MHFALDQSHTHTHAVALMIINMQMQQKEKCEIALVPAFERPMFDKQKIISSLSLLFGRGFIISDNRGLAGAERLIEDANATVESTIDDMGNVGDGNDVANPLEPVVSVRLVTKAE